ncbi:phage tail tape measure protein [Pseudomonas sp. BCRC 81390]|uniref:phage tail tape measure protein n=1 Tax=Pseudomonas sp. BCRC 81390 TaxID=3054778 RepID=UPI00259AC5D3|nr:phage tail tape measure protein [Pseudomonas sp. BCRC 81390]MDM3884691.1 phage tail tape measure protein [Pseudomonas sp. BCRC 81390]
MAESKYSMRLVALDGFSSTFGDFKKKQKGLEESLKGHQAELRKLNAQAKDMAGLTKLREELKRDEEALKKAREEQARLTREQEQAKAKAAELSSAYGRAAAATKSLEESSKASKAQVAAARSEQNRLGKELDLVTASMRKLDTQQDKATAGANALERVVRRERDELTRLDASLTKAGVDTSKLTAEQNRLKAATESVNAALQGQRAKLDAVSAAQKRVDANKAARADLRGQVAETAALGYLASRPVDKAMQLETAMADVGKVINFEGNQREEMAAANLRMASDRLIASSGMTAVDLAKIEYAAGQSGIGNDEKTSEGKQARVMEFTRDAAIMGSAFDIDAQTAGETMAGWKASMRLDRTQTLDLADSVNYLGNNFNAKAADIAAVVKRFGAVGSASGLTPEQTAALSTALLNPGTEKEIAGTGFKNFTSALVAGKSATKGEKAQWKELGFDPEELARDMQTNAPATIMQVLKVIRDQPREEQAAIATTLFGSESIGAIQPLLENLEPLEQAFGLVADKTKYATSALGEQASMMQEAAGVANTSRTGWNAFTARLTRLSTIVGTAMLPVLNAVLMPLGALVDGLSWAAETFPNLTGTLAVAAGGIAALNVGALGLKFVGLLFGQTFNRAGLAKAKMDLTTAQTATSATGALVRLNGALDGLGKGGGLEGRKARRRGRRGGRASAEGPAAVHGANAAKAAKVAADGAAAAKVAAEGAGAAKGVGGALAGAKSVAGTAAKFVGKAAVPLVLATSGVQVVQGLVEGDASAVASGVGAAGGGMAGAWAGGAAGAAIGSVVPIIGTAIGGAIGAALGGYFGSEAGSALGEGIVNLFEGSGDKGEDGKDAPAAAAKPLSATAPGAPGASGQDGKAAPAVAAQSLSATVPGAPGASGQDGKAAPAVAAQSLSVTAPGAPGASGKDGKEGPAVAAKALSASLPGAAGAGGKDGQEGPAAAAKALSVSLPGAAVASGKDGKDAPAASVATLSVSAQVAQVSAERVREGAQKALDAASPAEGRVDPRLSPGALEAAPRLASPAQVGREVVAAVAAVVSPPPPPPPPPVFPPIHIEINGQDQATAQALVDKVMQRLKSEIMPMFNPLTARSGAMLTDGVS